MSDQDSNKDETVGDDWAAALAEQTTSGADDDWSAALQEQSSGGREHDVKMAGLQELHEGWSSSGSDINMEMILDIPVDISMEIGRTKISIRNLLQLTQGSVVELDRMAGEPLDVMVNGTLIAHGEVVVVNEKFGIRLTDVISATERVKRLK